MINSEDILLSTMRAMFHLDLSWLWFSIFQQETCQPDNGQGNQCGLVL